MFRVFGALLRGEVTTAHPSNKRSQRESAVLTSRDGSGRFYQVSPVL